MFVKIGFHVVLAGFKFVFVVLVVLRKGLRGPRLASSSLLPKVTLNLYSFRVHF